MYSKIIVPIDINSKNSWKLAVERAIIFSQNFQSKLYFVTVVPDYGLSIVQQYFPKGWINETIKKSKAELKKILEQHIKKDVDYEVRADQGTIYQVIIDLADDLKADLIIMAAHHTARSDYLLGPITAKVVRHAKVSVLVVREE